MKYLLLVLCFLPSLSFAESVQTWVMPKGIKQNIYGGRTPVFIDHVSELKQISAKYKADSKLRSDENKQKRKQVLDSMKAKKGGKK